MVSLTVCMLIALGITGAVIGWCWVCHQLPVPEKHQIIICFGALGVLAFGLAIATDLGAFR